MTATVTRPVVVGVDDLEHSARAVTAGAREARLRGAPLWLAHAYHWLPPVVAGVTPGGDTPEGAVRDAATALLSRAVARTHAEFPDLEIHDYAMSGHPGPALADLAEDAALLVIGGRGRGGFAGMLLGSAALSTVAHARCPVLVVRGEREARPAEAGGRVLVGIDVLAPTTGTEVLGFAFEEAALHGYGLRAVHAWEDPGSFYPVAVGHHPRETLDEMDAERRRRLDSLIAPWRRKHPDTIVETQVVTGPPSKKLVESSRTADLLVIGGLHYTGSTGIRLGGLGHTLLHYAHCPVVVVPEG
ncbi:universal stress protein [Catenulispora subtropica]|uniref:universal stress protein n=1 Tax=Catenulispora subtropica TaxID=450798 RepID=UPI0031CF90A7